jgi:fumarate hydratase class II
VAELAALTGLPLRRATNAFAGNAARDSLVAMAGALRGIAIAKTKLANDLRWMGSGPTSGLAEVRLPALQAGSSIMPGKVNPVIPEAVLQVCARVVGNDATVAWAGASGSFELTPAMPVMADAVLESTTLLARVVTLLDERCLRGLDVDRDAMAERAARSPALATALNGLVGYEHAAGIVRDANAEGVTLAVMVGRLVERGELPQQALSAIDPLRLAWPHGRPDQTEA